MYRRRLHKFTTCVLSICLVLYDSKICLKYYTGNLALGNTNITSKQECTQVLQTNSNTPRVIIKPHERHLIWKSCLGTIMYK